MSRTLTSAAVRAVNAAESDAAFLVLIQFDHPELSSPIRVTSDAVATVFAGKTYLPYPFDITLPDDSDQALPQVRLTIDNVDRALIETIRTIAAPPTVTVQVVMAAPGTAPSLEAGPFIFTLKGVTYDALSIQGTLGMEDLLNEGFPGFAFAPKDFPGLFG